MRWDRLKLQSMCNFFAFLVFDPLITINLKTSTFQTFLLHTIMVLFVLNLKFTSVHNYLLLNMDFDFQPPLWIKAS